ncbi:signal peptidase I [Rhodococcoides kroppenstedtii]|uniref:Signal peptidase I n=1 Tax=Rhodococcoides kroppenstedtii TaxID=293050 RepID=A0A1I0TVY1_9NOCA|nr:signal peptidase I [Rhodococcus kroppenstedtii]SFA55783.1 signal peptidase I [Rhodococcus kroppenstedtii]
MPESEPTDVDASRPLPRPLDRALSVIAVLGALSLTFALCATLFSLTPLVFRSGSMEPAIPTGSLAVARDVPASEVAEGDVVSVLRTDGSRITHRVERVDSVHGDTATLILRGDANDAPDADPYVVADIDRVVGHVPVLGYAASWLATPVAWVVGALLAVGLVVLIVRPDVPAPSSSRGRHRVAATAGAALVAVIVVPSVGRTDGTVAALSDSAQVSVQVAAVTLSPPATLRCDPVSSNTVRLTFPRVSIPGATPEYRLGLRGSTAQVVPSTTDPVTFDLNRSFLGGLFLSGDRVVDVVTVLGTWTSGSAVSQTVTYGAVTGLTCKTPGAGGVSSAPVRSFGAQALSGPTSTATSGPSTTAPPTTTTTPTTASTSPGAATPGPSSSASAAPTQPTTSTPPTSTTPPPPPASAFVAEGGSSSSGGATASVSGGTLTVTDASGATLLTRPVTTSARYGTGVVWSSTGDLYVLSDAGVTRIVVGNGTASAGPASTESLPTDIRALL